MNLDLNMLNKILALCISANLVFAPVALADEAPKYTHLEENESAPFSGTLFNPAATASLIAESQFNMDSCDLRVEFEVTKSEAKCQLQVEALQISYDSLLERHNLLMDIKQQELETYKAMAIEQPNKHNQWWLAGGIVAGISLTLGVFAVSQEIQK